MVVVATVVLQPRLLDEKAIRQYMSIGHGTFWAYRYKGWITPVRGFGRRSLYERADVDALIDKLKSGEALDGEPARRVR